MSLAASLYVKHLKSAPNGERITPQEKAVLAQLADDHREEAGGVWLFMGTLAERSCVSRRHCRRIITTLCKKGVIQLRASWREKDGGQSSNEFRFCQLDPEFEKQPHAVVEMRRKLQKTPRTYVSQGDRQKSPRGADKRVTGGRTKMSEGVGQVRPTTEPLEDLSGGVSSDSLFDQDPPTPLRGVRTTVDQRKRWEHFQLMLKSDLCSIPDNVAKKFEPLVAGQNDFDSAFREWWLLEVIDHPKKTEFVTEASDSALTTKAVTKYFKRIVLTLRKFYLVDDDVKITVRALADRNVA